MKKIKKYFFLFFVQILIMQNTIAVSQSLNKIEIKELLSIGGIENELIYQWAGVTTDNNGNIFISDMMDYSVKKFSKGGNFLKKAGRKGKGPGEYEAIRLIKHFDGNLYITDQWNIGINILDTELNFIEHINIIYPILDFQKLRENFFAIAPMSLTKNAKVFIFDKTGMVCDSIIYNKKDENVGMMNSISFEVDLENNFYVAYKFIDKILKIDDENKIIWEKTFFKGKKSKIKKFAGFIVPGKIFYKDIEIDAFGNLFILGGSYSKNKSKDIYVLTSDGKEIDVITLPESSHMLHIDLENHLYSRSEMGAGLKKYKIKYILE